MRVGRWVAGVAAVGVTLAASPAVAQAMVVGDSPLATYQTNGRVEVIAVQGTTAYIGGKFTSVRPAGDPLGTGEVTRNRAAAIDLTTGQVLQWNPNLSGTVQALAVDGNLVFVGGSFQQAGGKGAKRLIAVDVTTGAVQWKATMDAQVTSLVVRAGVVYASGSFANADGVARPFLAAFDESTGALDTTWAPTADQQVTAMTLTADGSKIVVGGSFTHLDGVSQNHLGALDPTTGAVLSWKSHTTYAVVSLAADAAGVYAGGAGSGGNFAAFSPSTGQQLWQGGTDGNVQAIGVLDGVVYAGGHYENYCGPGAGQHTCTTPTPRSKLLAVDETTGALEPWDPGANSVLGVFALTGDTATGDMLAGGDFTHIGGQDQQGFADFRE